MIANQHIQRVRTNISFLLTLSAAPTTHTRRVQLHVQTLLTAHRERRARLAWIRRWRRCLFERNNKNGLMNECMECVCVCVCTGDGVGDGVGAGVGFGVFSIK